MTGVSRPDVSWDPNFHANKLADDKQLDRHYGALGRLRQEDHLFEDTHGLLDSGGGKG